MQRDAFSSHLDCPLLCILLGNAAGSGIWAPSCAQPRLAFTSVPRVSVLTANPELHPCLTSHCSSPSSRGLQRHSQSSAKGRKGGRTSRKGQQEQCSSRNKRGAQGGTGDEGRGTPQLPAQQGGIDALAQPRIQAQQLGRSRSGGTSGRAHRAPGTQREFAFP